MITQDEMDAISRKLFRPLILVLDAWTFQYLVLVYYARRREVRVWMLVLASFLGFATHLYVHDDLDTDLALNTVSETSIQLTFTIQIVIIGYDVCVKVKLRSIRYLTHVAEFLIVLGWLQVIASLIEVLGFEGSRAIHVFGNVLETTSLVFVLVFRFYYLSLSRGFRRLMSERKLEIVLYVLFAIHEFPFILLELHTDVTWEFAQGLFNRVVVVACILQNLRKKAIPSSSSYVANSKRSSIANHGASLKSSRGSVVRVHSGTLTPRSASRGSLRIMGSRRSDSNNQAFPDITKIAVISEKQDDG
jgi:hypothetical protein